MFLAKYVARDTTIDYYQVYEVDSETRRLTVDLSATPTKTSGIFG